MSEKSEILIKELLRDQFGPFLPLMAEVECGSHFDVDNPHHHAWLDRRIETYYLRGTHFFASYLDDGTSTGLAAVLIEEGPEGVTCMGQTAELLDIAVYQAFRGQGTGTALLLHVEGYVRACGKYCLYVATYARNYKAIAFYGRNGYVPVATLPDVHGAGDEGNVYLRKILQ